MDEHLLWPGSQIDERALTSAVLSDSLDALSLRDQVLAERLTAIAPGSRLLGRARTAQFLPASGAGAADDADPYGMSIDFISSLLPGDVAVIATDGSNASAFWGELFSAAAMGAGAQGVVTDGNVRDSAKIARLGFPVFARSRRPVDYRGRMDLVGVDGAVALSGVSIREGDLVCADEDGVVVVPKEKERDVLVEAKARISTEGAVLRELLAGETLRAVWTRHGVL